MSENFAQQSVWKPVLLRARQTLTEYRIQILVSGVLRGLKISFSKNMEPFDEFRTNLSRCASFLVT